MEDPDLQSTMTGEEVVITGMSGSFPNSDSVHEFMENLYNKVDMVSIDPNCNKCDPAAPKHVGKINGIDKFDATFFRVGYQLAAAMDPIARLIMEHAYGALFDSGNTHTTLEDNIVGVFIGSSYADYSALEISRSPGAYSLVNGTSKSMFANRISYWMNGKGPSFCIDFSCASSAAALEQAVNFIKTGIIDAAVVGASNLCSDASLTKNIRRAGMLCLDGKTKCFDKNGDGCVRSEAVSLIFLQKAKDAKRIYAEVVYAEGGYHLKANDRFLPIRKSEQLQKFLNDIYSKTDVDPKNVEYVEAHGAALAEADGNEADAIASVFSGDKAVKVGSVKSNMGHSEPASGLCSITKLCLAYHKGEIPANLHLKEPVQTAQDGRVQVVTENTKFERGYTAMNNLSYTGANFHVILKGHYKKKNLDKYNCNIPRLVLASGRQEPGVRKILDALKSKQVDAEEIALLHNIFKNDIGGHTGRGYTILDTINESTVALSESVDYYSGIKSPLWFVYSGMGSQWLGMGADLMRIPTFAAAIQRCHNVLEPMGINLIRVITEVDKTIFDNVTHAFVGIGAMQVALTDVLKELGIVPDYIIGHSLGETACAYQDGTMTAEQTILCTYYRAKSTQTCVLVNGAMAAVGLGYTTVKKLCPPEIDIACHNSSESTTISGPAGVIEQYVAELTKQGVFVRAIPTGNVAYHSRYIAAAGPVLLENLKNVITDSKPRSSKWISTSVPREKWHEPYAKYSSAEYHVNNLLNPVLFDEITRLIPDNAVVVEVAPHGLLQAVMKRSLKSCTHVPLTKRGTTDGVKFLLEAIGKLYIAGLNPKVENLYPKVTFPVSTGTPLLSHLIEWEHSENWPTITLNKNIKVRTTSRTIVFSLLDDDYKYLDLYVRNGVNVLPEAALIAFVWETLSMYKETDFRDLSVTFKNIQFHGEVIVTAESPVRLNVMISKGNDTFEVTHEDKLIVSGTVYGVKLIKFQNMLKYHKHFDEFETDVKLTEHDIYRILEMRGFTYSDAFHSIASSNLNCTRALIKWTGRWIPFLDSIIQLNIISRGYKRISKPKLIKQLKVSVFEQENATATTVDGFKCYEAQINNTYGMTKCAGVLIEDILYMDVPLEENMADALESQTFCPFYPTEEVNMKTAIEINVQIISENTKSNTILITKVVKGAKSNEYNFIDEAVNNVYTASEINTVHTENDELLSKNEYNDDNKTNVIFMENVLQNLQKMRTLQNLSEDTFILSLEDKVPKLQSVKDIFIILSCMSDGKKILVLLKKLNQNSINNTCYIPIRFDDTFSWVPNVYSKLATTNRVVLISERQPYCGILGFVRKLKATGHNNVSVVIVDDFNSPNFDPDNDLFKEQLQKNMTINILKKGQWGSFYFKSSIMSKALKSFALRNLTPGSADNILWVEAPKISGHREFAQVYYSGLTMNDCHKVMDDTDNDNGPSLLGLDFSGLDKNGDKVMGLISGGSAGSTIEVDPDLLWPVPDQWSLEDAATVPLAYVQAYYCLSIRRQLQKGIMVLICDGTSSVGLASISLCLSYSCTVFTVVDSEEKKKILLKLYPELQDGNIICCSDDGFLSILLSRTNGNKCDFVINFAPSPIREAALNCVGCLGILFDFGKNDIYNNEVIGMNCLKQGRNYVAVDVSNIFRPEFSRDKKVLQNLIAEGIASGVVRPLNRVVFSPDKVSKAIKVLTINQHIGQILIRIRDHNIVSNGLEAVPRISYSPQDVIVIVCDERGIGIELADKLVERGARNIALHLKTSPVSGYVHLKLIIWSRKKVSVKLCSDDLQSEKGSANFIKIAKKFGKVKGVFVVFDPRHTDNEIKEDFVNAFMKQSLVVMNLDVALRNCVDLSHFVVLSPVTQSASDEYSLSLIERICDKRNEIGLQTLVVRFESLAVLGDYKPMNKTKPQSLTALFNAIEVSMKLKYTNVVTYNRKIEKEEIFKEEEEDGMYAFYRQLESEEDNMDSQALVELPTLLNNGENIDWNPNESYIILVPGFEGRSQVFESAAERLKMRAVAVQLEPDLEGEDIYEIACRVRAEIKKTILDEMDDCEEVMKKAKRDKKFFIMGYSFGVNIALQLAAILEKEGRTGVVYCIDSSPDALRATLESVLGKVSEDQLQNHVLNHMYNLLTGKKGKELKREMEDIPTLDAKVEECLRRMKGLALYSKQYKKLVLESAYKRIVMAQNYKPQFKLRSQLVLMKNSKHLLAGTLPDDYDLSKYSEKPVKVFTLKAGDLSTAPYDSRVTNIVNMFVDEKILNNF